MATPQRSASRATWLILFAAMANATVLYAVIGFVIAQERTAPPPANLPLLRTIFYGLAAVDLALAVLLMQRRALARVQDPASGQNRPIAPDAFQRESIIAMSLAEAAAIFGFILVMMGAPPMDYLPFGVAALAVFLAAILPAGLGYWREIEASGPGAGSGPIG